MSQPSEGAAMPTFNTQYGELVKEVFRAHVAQQHPTASDLLELARTAGARGKPDFVLAYLIVLDLADDAKRELLAQAFERRAELTEQKAAALDAEHHRPFPLLGVEARKDRTMARQVRQGKMIRPYARAPKPIGVQ